MTKDQALSEIKTAEAEVERERLNAANWWQKWHGGADAERKATELAIERKYTLRYGKKHAAAKKRHAEAQDAVTALHIKYATALCGMPIDSVMVEWINDWKWSPTGRTGRLEVFLDGAEWPGDSYTRPPIGTVVIRVLGKRGQPTKMASLLSREARDTSFRKYVWLAKGKRPKETTQ